MFHLQRNLLTKDVATMQD